MESFGKLELCWAQGYKGDKILHINPDTICYTCGNVVKFIDTVNGKEQAFHSPGNGACAVATLPSQGIFAVAEMGLKPRIFVCRYPTLQVIRTLEGGAELEYTHIAFSTFGSYIAATSAVPDFSIYVWDWSNGQLKCQDKLLSEDRILSLQFNPLNHHQISLIGSSRITLWTIQECNQLLTLNSRKINLPTSTGMMLNEDEEGTSRAGTRMGFNVVLPTSTKAGLTEENVNKFADLEHRHTFMVPVSQCWSNQGQVYVGCMGGQLLCINQEKDQVVLMLAETSDFYVTGQVEQGMFSSIALNTEGIIAGGSDGFLRLIQIINKDIRIKEIWNAKNAISSVSFSPGMFIDVAYGTTDGSIYRFDTRHARCSTVCLVHFGQFIGISYANGGKHCVACKDNGELQIWESVSGLFLGAISLQTRATSVACCPSSPVVAVGTATGHVYYIDITVQDSGHDTEEFELRVIHCVRMHRAPVTFLRYDPLGDFLLTASSEENKVFVVDSRASSHFACVGYVDCGGPIVSLAVHFKHVLALTNPSGEPKTPTSGNVVVVFSVPKELTSKSVDHFQSLRKNIKDESVKFLRYELSVPVDCAVITKYGETIELAALSTLEKTLLQFELPKKRSSQSEEQEVIHPVAQYVGHQLDGGKLILSPHGKWLASTSRDGFILIRDLSDWYSTVKIRAHSFMDGGSNSIAFSPDAQQIASVGKTDTSLVTFTWEFLSKGRVAANSAVEYARNLNMQLRSDWVQEIQMISGMEEWLHPDVDEKHAIFTPESNISGIDLNSHTPSSAVGLNLRVNDDELQATSATASNLTVVSNGIFPDEDTWYDQQVAIAVTEENQKYDEEKKGLRKTIKELRKLILGMMKENEQLPELEQLRHDEFNLDAEEQKRMQAEQDKKVAETREEIHFEMLAQRYLAYLIQKECWEDMHVKGRSLKTFNQLVAVNNYPLKPILPEESALLEKVTQIRTIEVAESGIRKFVLESSTNKLTAGEEDDDEDDATNFSLSLHGSLGPKFSGDNDLFYSQFELHTREEQISQIVLVKDAIRRIKEAFNEAFTSVYKNKEQENSRIKERNIRIRAIMQELGMDSASIFDQELDEDEMPEKTFEVSDSEVMVERVLSEEQKREKDDLERIEEERRAAAKGDNKRERALNDMMGGVLEVKKEDALKQDLPPPDFSVEKLEKDWNDEEKKRMKEFEKKLKELQEEREKHRKNLENELKKLQQSNLDGMVAFDEALVLLFNRKVKTEMVINQEELKILRLTSSIMVDDELVLQELHLNYLYNLKTINQNDSIARVEDIRKLVDEFQEVYDNIVAEDKLLDRGFRREFSDGISLSIIDQLYKLFRRRPKIQRQRIVEMKQPATYDPYGNIERATLPPPIKSDPVYLGLTELDDEANMPEGVDHGVWSRLCDTRRTKVESELRVKRNAMTLAEMTQYLNQRLQEEDTLRQDIEDVLKQQQKLCEDRMKHSLNLEIQFLLKQGQVEIAIGCFTPDYTDSILIHRGVVEDLNGTIRALGEGKVAAMTESKDFKKGIHQLEWERKRMIMQMDDLHNRARHIQMLKLTKDIQAYLNDDLHRSKQVKQIMALEQTLTMQDRQFDRELENSDGIKKGINRTIRSKERENENLDKILEELHVAVSERQNIADVNASERAKNTSDRRLRGIVQRRKLVDLAKAQAQEVAVLRAEVERLRMKTFPALVQVER